MNKQKYYNISNDKQKNSYDINIFGDIEAPFWGYGENNIEALSEKIDAMDNPSEINIYINSYGGELAEGLAIYNALKKKKCTINTYNLGFACSSASIVFMSGNNRFMSKSSVLMIHNVSQYACGNSKDFRKLADDLEILNETVRNVYTENCKNISEKEIIEMMDNETFISFESSLEYGFATDLYNVDSEKHTNNALDTIINRLFNNNSLKNTIDNNIMNVDLTSIKNAESEEEEEEEEKTTEETTEEEETKTEETETEETETETTKEEEEEEEEDETSQNLYISNFLKIFK